MALLDYLPGMSHSASLARLAGSPTETADSTTPTADTKTEIPHDADDDHHVSSETLSDVVTDTVPHAGLATVNESPSVTSVNETTDKPLPELVVAAEQVPATIDASDVPVVPATEEAKETFVAETSKVEDAGASLAADPGVEENPQQPTLTHAEAGTAHTETEPATTLEGVQADKPLDAEPVLATEETAPAPVPKEDSLTPNVQAEAKPDAQEHQKVSAKEKVEKVDKTKAEGKGFLARLFGSKDKSPKKEKKVKTPKAEKVDPIAEAVPVETPSAPASNIEQAEVIPGTAKQSVPVITAADSEEPESTPADLGPTTETLAETEDTAVPSHVEQQEASTVAEDAAKSKDEPAKPNLKAHRRLSARIGDMFKLKKAMGAHSPSEETPQEITKSEVVETTSAPVSAEAPKLEKPVETEPLKLEDESKSGVAVGTTPATDAA
ncbi:hypothetical protein IAU60_005734 [Kwoniella sp. DSM 27419]